MLQLPKGYYAVQSDFENASKCTFVYKGVTYWVEQGINLFATLAEAMEHAREMPDQVLRGLPYDSFTAPVILLSAGEHRVGVKRDEAVRFFESCVILGEGAGINPNVPSGDRLAAPTLNALRDGKNETVLRGGHDFGNMWMQANAPAELMLFDGFSCKRTRFADNRSDSGDRLCKYVFKNIVHISPCGHPIYAFGQISATTALRREIWMENIRVANFSDLGYGGILARLNAQKATLKGVCVDHTSQVFGFTDIPRGFNNCSQNSDVCEFLITDCYFRDLGGENGISTGCHGVGDKAIRLTVENSVFVDAARPGEGFLQPHLANENCKLTVRNSHFVDTRGNQNAITVVGNGNNIEIFDCSFQGFAAQWGRLTPPPASAPDRIENRAQDWQTATIDPHTVIGTDHADFTVLDTRYAGYRAYYGDQHAHTDCGGRSDGKFPMKDWPAAMDEKQLDFAAIVDHRQMRGFFLPEWDEERFIIGTEPGTTITNTNAADVAQMHYNMLFPHKYGLAMVLANFPEFEFRGDELTGSFIYPKFTKERFAELTACVQSIGGLMVHPHPKSLMGSDDPLDYYVGENMYLEVMVGTYDRHSSIRSYDLWCDLLALGKHVYAAGGSDTHGQVSHACVSTFYSKEKSGRAFFDRMHAADYTVGALGMQMCIGDHPMGSRIAYQDGMKLTLRVGDFYAPAFKENTAYELRVVTDQGVAYASLFNGKEAQEISLEVQPRKFYRAEVVDLTHGGYRMAIGNPIWLDADQTPTAE